MDFTTKSGQALKDALSADFSSLDNEALTAAMNDRRTAAKALFGLESPTIAQVNDAEALVASLDEVKKEDKKRKDDVKDAEERFAAAQATFSDDEGSEDEGADEGSEDEGTDEGGEGSEDEGSEGSEDEGTDEGSEDEGSDEGTDEGGEGSEGGESVSASQSQRITASKASAKKAPAKTTSAASRVGARAKRPVRAASEPRAVVTAAADVPGYSTGQHLSGMDEVGQAMINRFKSFGKYNERTAEAVRASNGGVPNLVKTGLAHVGTEYDKSLVASAGNDYSAVRTAITERDKALRSDDPMVAAGWCAPSTPTYTYMADYVVDGLLSLPEVSAPRGGIMLTTGPARAGLSQGQANLDGFGFIQTEAEAEAGEVKPLEEIVCPEFTDHRLDAIGYGYTIPFLTQKAYPELVKDTLQFASVLWAHKVNRYLINAIVGLSDTRTYKGFGATTTDTLEALSLLALKERRKWNLGRNAVMEVKVPEFAREVFRADISRRNDMRADSVPDAMIDKHFTDRHLAVEYIADWQELTGENIVLPATFDVLVYPSGTFVKAVEDVVNLSAFYDTASVTVNQYTGVFFEQGILVAKAGYGSSKVTLPINPSGEQGALDLKARITT